MRAIRRMRHTSSSRTLRARRTDPTWRTEADHLKEQIARLDIAFAHGELDSDSYELYRAQLKSRLLALVRGQDGEKLA